jgi:hypothetical protein
MPSIVQPSCGMHALARKPMLVVQQPKPTVVDTQLYTRSSIEHRQRDPSIDTSISHGIDCKIAPSQQRFSVLSQSSAPTKALQASIRLWSTLVDYTKKNQSQMRHQSRRCCVSRPGVTSRGGVLSAGRPGRGQCWSEVDDVGQLPFSP